MKNTATTSAFTAGPWFEDSVLSETPWECRRAYITTGEDADGNCRTVAAAYGSTTAECRANALLIAAAPELLEHCKGFLDDVRQMEVDPDVSSNWDWSLTKKNLEWLIEKAEGRSS